MSEMSEFADLIGIPYKDGGRGQGGYDCYGLVIEAARRRGLHLRDVVYNNHSPELVYEYAPTMNVMRIDGAEKNAIIEMVSGDELHIGFCVNEKTMIHATRNQGVRLSRIGALPVTNFYRITTEIALYK